MATTPRIAIAVGDPAGIGPEISLRAAFDPQVRASCQPLLVGDPVVIEAHAKAANIAAMLAVASSVGAMRWDGDAGVVNVLSAPMREPMPVTFGVNGAAFGQATLAAASRAIRAGRDGEVDAVVAAPHNQTSIAAAGIAFDGYPGFVARETGMAEEDVFLMLCFGERRLVHATLHVGVARALSLITRDRVARVVRAADTALRQMGVASPSICVSGVNPHAGEGGLFGREEIEIVSPAIADARAEGIDVSGPLGADTMYAKAADAYVVMLHDQGHIPAKLLAPNGAAAVTIGSPVLFSSVAHGTAFDIAGKGVASPRALIEAIARVCGAKPKGADASPRAA